MTDLKLTNVPNGYRAEVAYKINQTKYYLSALSMAKLLISTQFQVKRDPIYPYF